MIINTNVMALNTNRQLGINETNTAKSLEKLSSGYRINRAGDDAAGLAISEKMRGQIRGLQQASRNAQDGISLIQTAEGALQETEDILQRMRELAVQAANGTLADGDRQAIQDEVDQLVAEIDRIAETTEFNTKSLLDGTFTTSFQIGANAAQNVEVSIGKMDAKTLGVTDQSTSEAAKVVNPTNLLGVRSVDLEAGVEVGNYTLSIVSDGATNATVSLYLKDAEGNVVAENEGFDPTGFSATNFEVVTLGKVGTFASDVHLVVDVVTATAEWTALSGMAAYQTVTTAIEVSGQGIDLTAPSSGEIDAIDLIAGKLDEGSYRISITEDGTNTVGKIQVDVDGTYVDLVDSSGLVYTTGPIDGTNGGNYTITFKDLSGNQATLSFQVEAIAGNVDIDFDYVIGSGAGDSIDVSSSTSAAELAITAVNNAIEQVSTQRASMGAYQNRLEHTIKNLDTSAENLQASESRIRDVDMATQMVEFTKQNILQQAATAMLAQANQAPQNVLQLLR